MRSYTPFALIIYLFIACQPKQETQSTQNSLFEPQSSQLKYLVSNTLNDTLVPRTFENGEYRLIKKEDWCSGFPAGSYWYMYELTGDTTWRDIAVLNTEKLNGLQYYRKTHDLGFMIFCSYGNAYRITKNEAYKQVIIDASESLISRFNPTTGTIKSWDWSKEWQYPVIIDNMMNLEMLFWTSKVTGDLKYRDVAITHANTTLANHFRENMSSVHVVDYDTLTGAVIQKKTHQGISDESSWARGQAWGLYGYTMCFRETGDSTYLDAAKKIAAFILPNLPADFVPYWDFDDPSIPNAPLDASAAAISASALYMLSTLTDEGKEKYVTAADNIMVSLSSPEYLASVGENGGFLIKHCTGNKPKNSEVDTPLNYADYYYLEALKFQTLNKK